MKKNVLNAAIVAGLLAAVGLAGGAQAVELSPDGLGQVLIYPYYTVNRNQQTVISVVNATNAAKAVKVRFLEGYNAREVLDFNLFLSGFDVWTGTVFALTDGGLPGDGAALLTDDRSCTAPSSAEWEVLNPNHPGRRYLAFRDSAYTGAHQDSGPVDKARQREGHVELLQMADLGGTLRNAVTHVAGGVPANCNVVQAVDPANTGLLAPTGGLFGAGGIVNVAQGTFYGYNADALGGFSRIPLFAASGMPTPSLAQANTTPDTATAKVLDATGELFRSDFPTSGQSSQAIDAVSAVFMASSLLNEYNVDAQVGSNTDWVVTFPTKRFYTDPEILGVPLGAAGALPPFTYTFGQPVAGNVYGDPGNGDGQSCSRITFRQFDREGSRAPEYGPGYIGSTPLNLSTLCGSVNVVSFLSRNSPATDSAVLASRRFVRIPPYAIFGWLQLDLNPVIQPHALRASRDGDVFDGLPATGFQAVNYVHVNVVPGTLSNYSTTFRYRALRNCRNAAAGGCS